MGDANYKFTPFDVAPQNNLLYDSHTSTVIFEGYSECLQSLNA